jgi:murein tripeptide amidase MpaA
MMFICPLGPLSPLGLLGPFFLALTAFLFSPAAALADSAYGFDYTRMYDYEGLTSALERIATDRPDLVKMRSLGLSPAGRHIWLLTIANRTAGPPLELRPAFYAQGNLHAVELAGSMHCLYLAEYLVRHYGRDEQVTRQLDNQVYYIVPRSNPDGAEHVITTGHNVRSEFVDVKERNVPYPQDLDGDGRILTIMREDPKGRRIRSQHDPRLFVSRPRGEKAVGPFYRELREGLIHHWDGRSFAASRARNDFNRNFPVDWRPFYSSLGQGRFPLSEEETRAVGEFCLNHPNIAHSVDYHTGNIALFYPPRTFRDHADHPQDSQLVIEIGEMGERLTGCPLRGSYGGGPSNTPGVFKNWLYDELGVVAYTLELGIFHSFIEPANEGAGRGDRLDLATLRWGDENPQYSVFYDWRPFDHPQLGPVLIGGWNEVIWRNPPPFKLPEIYANATRFALDQFDYVPRVELDATAEKVEKNVYKITAAIRNAGPVPTSVTARWQDVYPQEKIEVELTADFPLEFVIGDRWQRIDHLDPGAAHPMQWIVRTKAKSLSLRASSTRGIFADEIINLP